MKLKTYVSDIYRHKVWHDVVIESILAGWSCRSSMNSTSLEHNLHVFDCVPTHPKCTAKDFFRRQWPDINSHTGDSLWQGETMDYGMAVDGMLYRQKQH